MNSARKCHNHRKLTNPQHREEKTQNTNKNQTTEKHIKSKATSSLFFSKSIAKLERILSVAFQPMYGIHKTYERREHQQKHVYRFRTHSSRSQRQKTWLLVLCCSSSRCCRWVCSVWLWYFLIVLTFFFYYCIGQIFALVSFVSALNKLEVRAKEPPPASWSKVGPTKD